VTDIKRIAARGIAGLCWLVMVCGGAWAQPSVWTHRYDNARSGVNAGEVQLNTSNVNPGQFGKLFSYGVDADIYTQPLVIANVAVAGKGTHNVVFVATNNNSVYAFDADTNRSGNDLPLWHVNFNGPGVTPIPATDVQTLNSIRTPGPIGIMGTPVIDQATGTLYVVARTKETAGASVTYVQRLHALDIRSGAEKFGGPVMITATVAGTGYDNAGGVVTFNARTANQRAGLALANGNVYIAWSSYGDGGFYHGWVMAYSASTLQQVGVFCITPDGSAAGVWQSGQPPSIDASGNLYLATGNGTFDGVRNFGQTILKLNPNLSTVLDWFTPGNWDSLNRSDRDLGSSGVLLVPGTNDVIGAGKDGLFYVLDRNNLGHSQSGNGQILQSFRVAIGNVHGGPTYWNGSAGPRVFVWGEDDYLKSFAVSGALLNTTPVSKSPYAAPPGMPGGFLTVSSNGTQAGSGVLWASLPYAEDANDEVVSGVLRAFDATDLSRELWNTRMVPARDDIGNFAKYVPPTVVNGRVYMSSFSNRLNVYGLLASIPAASGGSITGAGVLSSAAVDLTAVGTTDWAVWPQYEGKSTGNSRISDFGYLGASVGTFANAARRFTWNDGGLNLCSASASGVYAAGLNNGFLLTVPAGTTARTLRLYLGGNNSRGMLTARLSDGSAPQFVDTAFSSTGQYDVVYTLNFSAAASDEQLTVTWSQFSGAGNVTLQAAALSGPADPPSPTGCIWVDDATPLNATLTSSGGDSWTWVGSNPTPFSRGLAHQSAIAAGMHQHLFSNATTKMQVGTGDDLFAYVYLDPANPPTEVMLQWNDGSWEHRAYWGSNQLTAWGVDGTASRRYMGVLPPLGQWVKLSVPAAAVGLEGRTLSGMAFTLFGGRATFDYAGKTSAGATTYQLSGTVTQGGSALNGVVIAATNGVTCSSSDAAGRYACTVPQGWSGTVTPSKAGYTFTPASRTYSAVGADRTTENYAAAASAQTVLRKVRDFNGDGRDDILWRNTSTEQSAVWTMNGLAGSGAALYAVFPYLMRWTGDFDGDGKTDILFRSNQFGGLGEIAAWLMNGTAPAGSTVLLANPDWIPTHVADLDGDGKDDIVWRQGSTNNVAVWLMNGLAIKSSAVILAGQPNWQVEHTGDFDGDGKADLVWRNIGGNNQTAIWLMDGLTPKTTTLYPDPLYVVTHVGDLDGDGKSDLVWAGISGQKAVWLMDGLGVKSSALVLTSLNWNVTHLADLDGDGRMDLVWFNHATNETAVWLMNGTASTASAVILNSAQWKVTHIGDYDGDGRDDLLWYNFTTGATALWLMNGTATSSAAVIQTNVNWLVWPADGL